MRKQSTANDRLVVSTGLVNSEIGSPPPNTGLAEIVCGITLVLIGQYVSQRRSAEPA